MLLQTAPVPLNDQQPGGKRPEAVSSNRLGGIEDVHRYGIEGVVQPLRLSEEEYPP